jgi:hypothetical protein
LPQGDDKGIGGAFHVNSPLPRAAGLPILRLRIRPHKRLTIVLWSIDDVVRHGAPRALQGSRDKGRPNLFDPENLAANPPPERSLPAARRASRDTLIAIANNYFDGLASHDPSMIRSLSRKRESRAQSARENALLADFLLPEQHPPASSLGCGKSARDAWRGVA